MIRRSALSVTMLAMLALASCSKEEAAAPAASPGGAGAPSAGDQRVEKIPILPGYKYYAGGPKMTQDKYGRFRIMSFQGELQQPPSRGMIFGVKMDGNQMEYRLWGNGTLLSLQRGAMRDGLFWQDYVEQYRNGKVVARERYVNDDQAQVMKLTTEDVDPQTGEVIRTKETLRNYAPAEVADDDDEEEDDDAGTAAAPVAPKAAAKDAAK